MSTFNEWLHRRDESFHLDRFERGEDRKGTLDHIEILRQVGDKLHEIDKLVPTMMRTRRDIGEMIQKKVSGLVRNGANLLGGLPREALSVLTQLEEVIATLTNKENQDTVNRPGTAGQAYFVDDMQKLINQLRSQNHGADANLRAHHKRKYGEKEMETLRKGQYMMRSGRTFTPDRYPTAGV